MEINSNDRLANATTLLRIASIMIANDDIGAAIVALRDASVALAIEQDVRNEATVKRHMEKQ